MFGFIEWRQCACDVPAQATAIIDLLTLEMHVQGKHAGYDQKHVQSIDPNYAAGFTFGSGLAKYALESATLTVPGKINVVLEPSQLAGTLPAASELLKGCHLGCNPRSDGLMLQLAASRLDVGHQVRDCLQAWDT